MDYTSQLRTLMAQGTNNGLEEWINTQNPLDRADMWREVKRVTQLKLRKTGVNADFAINNAMQMDAEIAKLENNMLNLLHQRSVADQQRYQKEKTEASGLAMLPSTRDYLIMCHKMKTYNTEALKPLAVHILKSERDAGVYNPKNWRGYDDFLEGKDLPESTEKALAYRAKLLDLMLNDTDEAFNDWIFTQPLEDQGDIIRQIREILEESIEIHGEHPERPMPNMESFETWLTTYEQACLDEKAAEEDYVASIKKQAEFLGAPDSDPAQAEREKIIACIYYNFPNLEAYKEKARYYIASDKAAGTYNPTLWGPIEDKL